MQFFYQNPSKKVADVDFSIWPQSLMTNIMDSGQNSQYTTFPNIFSLISADPADLSHIEKNHFFEKIPIFGVENVL